MRSWAVYFGLQLVRVMRRSPEAAHTSGASGTGCSTETWVGCTYWRLRNM